MEDALTERELRVLAAVLGALERLDPAGARANEFAVGVSDRVRFLPQAEPAAPYREQARPSVALSAEQWLELRRWASEVVRDEGTLLEVVRSVERDDARAIIFAFGCEAAMHCAISPSEASFLTMLEREWNLSIE